MRRILVVDDALVEGVLVEGVLVEGVVVERDLVEGDLPARPAMRASPQRRAVRSAGRNTIEHFAGKHFAGKPYQRRGPLWAELPRKLSCNCHAGFHCRAGVT